jgi:hypothetical protein
MTELSDWKRCVLPSELAAARAAGKAEGIAEVNAALDAARATIAELEKRIGELEAQAQSGDHTPSIEYWRTQAELARDALTAERQRREECEAVLSRYTGTDIPGSGPASDYFTRYSDAGNDSADGRRG